MYKKSPTELTVPGSYNMDDECDKDACGFWSKTHNECGIASIASSSRVTIDNLKETGEPNSTVKE